MQSPRGFSLMSPVIKNLIIINAIIYLVTFLYPNLRVVLALHFPGSEGFQPYQLVTHMFTHGNLFHFLFNMYTLWMFGTAVEPIWGPKKFFIFYFICGFGALVLHYGTVALEIAGIQNIMQNVSDPEQLAVLQSNIDNIKRSILLGASGAIYGVLVAFAFIFPNQVLMLLFPPVPIKAKYMVMILVAIDLFYGIRGGDNVAHFAHLGGGIFGFIMLLYWRYRGKLFSHNY